MTKHTLLTREEALRARDLVRDRLGPGRHLKITTAALTKARDEGTFTGYASTFGGEPDLAGDVVAPGAFKQSIKDWKARGVWPPLLWNHERETPASVLGVITSMREDKRGLLVTGQLDLDHGPAVAVWRAMKSGRITAFSFAYVVIEEHKRADGANVLKVLDVLDVTITPTPANRNAQLVSVKSDEPDPEPTSEIDRINKQLDELAGPLVRKPQPGQVEAFLLEEKQRYVDEKLAEAEQAAWEGRMDINAVLDPVPVRVDAWMRPVTS